MKSMDTENIPSMVNDWIHSYAVKIGFNSTISEFTTTVLLAALLLVFMTGIHIAIRYLLSRVLKKVGDRTENHFFYYLLENKFPHNLAYVAPVILAKNALEITFYNFPKWIPILDKIIDAYIVLMIVWMIMSILSSGADVLRAHPTYKGKPLDSYLQVIRMVLLLYAIILLFSMFTGKSPLVFFTAMGAMSAVLLLMFKDTIMGFVASIQVTTNDMVRVGDWIEMPKFGADGDVTEINLTTVKVQNWDKTITTVPTYALISDSFKNWRGMQESGGRRIKRAIYLKQSSVRFIGEDELDRFKKIQGLKDYIEQKSEEINRHNEKINADKTVPVNGRNLTNLGLFRVYAEWFLKKHPDIRKDMSLIVRQLAPLERGVPMEIYVFTNTTAMVKYEGIAGDIFDHLIASVRYFDLEIFESTSNHLRITKES